MRVRELLAANAFCLLALSCAGCAKVEQPVGEYSIVDGHPTRLDDEPERPARPPASANNEPEGGVSVSRESPLADAGNSDQPTEPTKPPPPETGAAGRPSPVSPPVLVDAGATTAVPDNPACRLEDAERRGLDMYLMVDNNITISFPGTAIWETMTNGLISFVNDTRSKGTGVGIRYFGNTCDAEDYKVPAVEIAPLPGNAQLITNSTRALRWNASPMLPALEGALLHQKGRAAKLEAKQAVLLVSDGVAQDVTCLYTTQMLAESARDGVTQAPFVETHVIAVAVNTEVSQPLDALIERLGAFNTIAEAGGSGEAITTSITGDAAEFADALQRARRNAAPCEYKAPPGTGVNDFKVAQIPLLTQVPRVANERSCGLRQGWYYATESEPTPITLCPATCTWVRGEDNRKIQFSICPAP